MNTLLVSFAIFACIVGGVLFGALVRTRLSERHLHADGKDVVKVATALVVTLSALVLALLTATAKSSFDTKSAQVKQLAANFIMIDQLLAQYGPETVNARQLERRSLDELVNRIWDQGLRSQAQGAFQISHDTEEFNRTIFSLSPESEAQRVLKGRIVQTAADIAQARLSLYVQNGSTISIPFLATLVFWLTMIFAIFSLLARLEYAGRHYVLICCALSVSGSIFLILDLDQPFDGLMQISSRQLRGALAPLSS